MMIWPVASTIRRAAPAAPRPPDTPIATIFSPATPISTAAVPLGMTATPPETIRSSTACPPNQLPEREATSRWRLFPACQRSSRELEYVGRLVAEVPLSPQPLRHRRDVRCRRTNHRDLAACQ